MRTYPLSTEYPEYYERYIRLVPNGDIADVLREQGAQTQALLETIAEELTEKPYAPGKWSLKEVLGHLSDTERVMTYRMLAIARGESAPLPNMDQDEYVAAANFNHTAWAHLRANAAAVRSATLALLSTIDGEAWLRTGSVWDHTVSTRAFAYIIAGHELHHLNVIQDKYL